MQQKSSSSSDPDAVTESEPTDDEQAPESTTRVALALVSFFAFIAIGGITAFIIDIFLAMEFDLKNVDNIRHFMFCTTGVLLSGSAFFLLLHLGLWQKTAMDDEPEADDVEQSLFIRTMMILAQPQSGDPEGAPGFLNIVDKPSK